MIDHMDVLQILEVLQDRGEPLNITVKPCKEKEGKNNTLKRYTISNDIGDQTVVIARNITGINEHLQTVLRHYPHPAAINGQEVERQPTPTEPWIKTIFRNPADGELVISESEPDPGRWPYGEHAIMVAGVLAMTHHEWQANTVAYHALEEREDGHAARHWDNMKQVYATFPAHADLKFIKKSNDDSLVEIAHLNDTTISLYAHCQEQMKQAVLEGRVPKPWTGPVYDMAINHIKLPDDCPIPIAVHNQPIKANQEFSWKDQGLLHTITTALYGKDTGMTPVKQQLAGRPRQASTNPMVQVETPEDTLEWQLSCRVDIDYGTASVPDESRRISHGTGMEISAIATNARTGEERVLRADADFIIARTRWMDFLACWDPAKTDPQEMERLLNRYALIGAGEQESLQTEGRLRLQEEIKSQTALATGNTAEATRRYLELEAARLGSMIRNTPEQIEVKDPTGRITIIYQGDALE